MRCAGAWACSFSSARLFTDLSVFDNVAFQIREHADLPESMVRDLVLMKLHAVGLRPCMRRCPASCPGGMARRVALARAIALDPMLMLYDEPFTGLDPIALGVTANLIRALNGALGATSIVVTHDVEEALKIVDYVYYLSQGRIVAQGTPDEIARASPILWCISSSMAKRMVRCRTNIRAGRLPKSCASDVRPLLTFDSRHRRKYDRRDLAPGFRDALSGTHPRPFRNLHAQAAAGRARDLLHRRVIADHHPGVRSLRRDGARISGLSDAGDLWLGIGAGRAGGALARARARSGGRRVAVREPRRVPP